MIAARIWKRPSCFCRSTWRKPSSCAAESFRFGPAALTSGAPLKSRAAGGADKMYLQPLVALRDLVLRRCFGRIFGGVKPDCQVFDGLWWPLDPNWKKPSNTPNKRNKIPQNATKTPKKRPKTPPPRVAQISLCSANWRRPAPSSRRRRSSKGTSRGGTSEPSNSWGITHMDVGGQMGYERTMACHLF